MGGVAEWTKAAVLKTAARKCRGFESLLLRWHHNPGRTPASRRIIQMQATGLTTEEQTQGSLKWPGYSKLYQARGEMTERPKVLAC